MHVRTDVQRRACHVQAGTWGAALFNAHASMTQHPAVSAELYRKRASLMASTVAAWSDPVACCPDRLDRPSKTIYLAVGTRLGHIWLWRCRSDQAAPADPSKPCFELVRSLRRSHAYPLLHHVKCWHHVQGECSMAWGLLLTNAPFVQTANVSAS